MRPLELLAPAKDVDCGVAAIDHGADAVYIGAPRFGARSAAGNSVDDIGRLCRYAHQFGARVYVTVNTILFDEEVAEAVGLVGQLAAAGVDAVLVQDMALLDQLPQMRLHASTQTDNRTAEKVRWLHHCGFSRVVLARELSVDEIRDIHKQVPEMELEAFVHGALCVSYSGLCYASQHCFSRSANRGACAQFCRMKFDLVDADGRELIHQRHLLSLKDLCRVEHLSELAEAGVSSFKIEGRLKDADYVKNVTAAYSEALNQLVRRFPQRYVRSSRGRCSYTFHPDLHKTFNRGYTTYFLHDRQPGLASFDTPKAMGEYVGKVKALQPRSFTVAGTASFSNGDGLCFLDASRQLQGFRVNRAEGNRLYPQRMPAGLKPGMQLYRNVDQAFGQLLARPSAQRRMPLVLSLASVAEGFALSASYADRPELTAARVVVEAAHEAAQKPPHDYIVAQLSRLGGTPFECQRVELPDDFAFFLPASVLAEMRRELVARLTASSLEPEGVASTASLPADHLQVPRYEWPYLYNVSNAHARTFYNNMGVDAADAFELCEPSSAVLMQCRYCLRHELGFCRQRGGEQPSWREPLRLRLADGRQFPLQFDCRRCQMNVLSDTNTVKSHA